MEGCSKLENADPFKLSDAPVLRSVNVQVRDASWTERTKEEFNRLNHGSDEVESIAPLTRSDNGLPEGLLERAALPKLRVAAAHQRVRGVLIANEEQHRLDGAFSVSSLEEFGGISLPGFIIDSSNQ